MNTPREAAGAPRAPPAPIHPFADSQSLLTLIRDEPSSTLGDDDFLSEDENPTIPLRHRSQSFILRKSRSMPNFLPEDQRSVFSNDIWLGDGEGMSKAFAREVRIGGWIFVGDTKSGAYIVYDCVIQTKDGTNIHAHKRYSAFEKLRDTLMVELPRSLSSHIPSLPPKSALARYRPAFLDRRRRRLEQWIGAVLLHPDIGGCVTVRDWVME